MNAMCFVASSKTNNRYRQSLCQVLTNFFTGYFTHYRKTTCINHRMSIVDKFFGTISRFALSKKSTQLRHAHWSDTNMPLHRNTRLDDSFNVPCVVLVAFALHHFSIGTSNKSTGILDRLLGRHVKTPVRHINHAQTVLAASVNGHRHHHDFFKRYRDRAFVTE